MTGPDTTTTPEALSAALDAHNRWRRDDDGDEPEPNPTELGKTIDAAAGMLRTLSERVAALEAERADLAARKDGAYLERNQVVAALAKCFHSGVARTAIDGWSEDWHGCVYIDLPTGQVSWHFHDSQAYLFDGLPAYGGTWDGHDTPEKYRRVAALRADALKHDCLSDRIAEIEVAVDRIMDCVDQKREPVWSYRNTITSNSELIRGQCAAIRAALAAADAAVPQGEAVPDFLTTDELDELRRAAYNAGAADALERLIARASLPQSPAPAVQPSADSLRAALAEADRIMGHDDAMTEWRERWAHLWGQEGTKAQPSADKVNAERYRWLRARVRGERHLGTGHNQGFAFPSRFDLSPLGDIMRGSVAQHLDAAIDAARARTGDPA